MSGANEYLRNAVLHCAHIINLNEAALSKIQSVTYNGRAHKPEPAVKLDYIALEAGVDYKFSYANNTHVGTATVTVRGINNFSGTKKTTFTIDKAERPVTVKISASSISVGDTATIQVRGAKGEVTYKTSQRALRLSTAMEQSKESRSVKPGLQLILRRLLISIPAQNCRHQNCPCRAGFGSQSAYRHQAYLEGGRRRERLLYFPRRHADRGCQRQVCRHLHGQKANTNGTKYVYKIIASASVTGRSTHSKSVTVYRVDRPAISSLTNSGAK